MKSLFKYILFINLLLVTYHSSYSQGFQNIEWRFVTDGPRLVWDMEFMNELLIMPDGEDSLYYYDASDLYRLELINIIQAHGFYLEIINNFMYSVGGEAGCFHIYNIANIFNPILLGSFEEGIQLWDFSIFDEYLSIADFNYGVRILDISDPTNPYEINSYESQYYPLDVAVHESFAFICEERFGLRILNVSDIENIFEVASLPVQRHPDIAPTNFNLTYDNDLIYMSLGWGGLRIIDVHDPYNPEIIGAYDTGRPGWSHSFIRDVVIEGDHAYVIGAIPTAPGGWDTKSLAVLDVSDPTHPIRTGYYHFGYNYLHAIEVRDNIAYVAQIFTGVHILDCSAAAALPLRINLRPRYFNLISTFARPDTLDPEFIFRDLEHLEIVYQDDGAIYLPELGIDTIEELNVTEGYSVFCSQASELVINGTVLDPDTRYALNANQWNWLGYPFYKSQPVEEALRDIRRDLVIILDDQGGYWIPELNLNTLGNMHPGKGYYTYVDENLEFQYYQGEEYAKNPPSAITLVPEVENPPTPTGLPYVVVIGMTEGLRDLSPSIIEIYDRDLLVGKGIVQPEKEVSAVVAWGGAEERGVKGFIPGNTMMVKVKSADGQLLAVDRSQQFGAGAYAEIALDLDKSLLPREFVVDKAYPNPFNPTVTIPFSLPRAGEVTITLFNLLGQEVFQVNRLYAAGQHRFEFDATNIGQELVSGLYFLRMQYNSYNNIQKVLLLK